MATLKAIRSAFRTTVASELGAGVEVYATVPGSPVLPCLVLMPSDPAADFNVSMGRGTDTWFFDVIVLAPSADEAVGQDILDDYVTGQGSLSIREAVFNNRTLGLSNVDAHVSGVIAYGGRYEAVDVAHIGATLRLVVHTKGTE
jgi:hypothetical protein